MSSFIVCLICHELSAADNIGEVIVMDLPGILLQQSFFFQKKKKISFEKMTITKHNLFRVEFRLPSNRHQVLWVISSYWKDKNENKKKEKWVKSIYNKELGIDLSATC